LLLSQLEEIRSAPRAPIHRVEHRDHNQRKHNTGDRGNHGVLQSCRVISPIGQQEGYNEQGNGEISGSLLEALEVFVAWSRHVILSRSKGVDSRASAMPG